MVGCLDRVYEAALRLKEENGIRRINKVMDRHGAYAFYLQDLDGNWWEVQYEKKGIDDFFNPGGRHRHERARDRHRGIPRVKPSTR